MISLETAKSLLASGLCVLPAHAQEKRPTVAWQKFQSRRPTDEELGKWFPAPRCCVVCGAVSGNLEILDFDSHGAAFAPFLKKIPYQLARRLMTEQTPSGGFHVIYRCENPVGKNQKLALDPASRKVLIETRGEGGLFLCSPSDGYTMTQGSWDSVPVLSDAERALMMEAAKECGELRVEGGVDASRNAGSVENTADEKPSGFSNSTLHSQPSTLSPADDFNARGDVRALLREAGWKFFTAKGDSEEWTRAGKTSVCSATLRKMEDGTEIFYVFSSSVPEFEPGKGYNPFQVYACLKCQGDMSRAAVELLRLGFGEEEAPNYEYLLGENGNESVECGELRVELAEGGNEARSAELRAGEMAVEPARNSGLTASITASQNVPIGDLPGFLGVVYRDILETMPKKQPEYALAFALCAQSILCHQKFQSPQGFRANIYCLISGGSGSGKDWGRKYLKELFRLLAMTENVRESYQSFPAIQNDLRYEYSPKLILWDEFGKAIQMMNQRNASTYAKEIIPGLMKLYTSADSMFIPSVRADVKSSRKDRANYDPIPNPFVSLVGTATPEQLLGNLSMDMVSEGFLGRAFLFEEFEEKADPDSKPVRPTLRRRPLEVSDAVLSEASFQKNSPAQEWDPDGSATPKTSSSSGEPPQARIVDMTWDGERELQTLLDYQTDQARSELGILWSRAEEQAEKLALLYAVSRDPENPLIDEEAARWGCRFSEWFTRKRIRLANEWVAVSDFNAKQKEALRYVKKHGPVTQTQIRHRFWYWSKKEREDVLDSLLSGGKLQMEKRKEGSDKGTIIWK